MASLNPNPPTPEELIRYRLLLQALDILGDLGSQVSVLSARILVVVAANPGITVGDVADRLALSQSTVSQTLTGLGVRRMTSKGLLDLHPDPTNYARRLIYLTPKGRALMGKVVGALGK